MNAALGRAGNPYAAGADASAAMNATLLALLPALACSSVVTGTGVLINLGVAATVTMLATGISRWARLPAGDYRVALITAIILAFALPPTAPLWLTGSTALVATLFRLALAAYGRPDAPDAAAQNTQRVDRFREPAAQRFNPAMLGYAFVFLAFPHALSYSTSDGSSGATALIAMAQRAPATITEIRNMSPAFGHWGGNAAEWLGFAWLLGGLSLLWRRVITWHTPIGCIAGVCIAAGIGYEGDSAYGGATALHHLLSGSTLLIAWFVLTDPGSAPRQPTAQLLYGLCAGALIYAVRESAGGADRSAFIVLLMNALAATFDVLAVSLLARYARHRQSVVNDRMEMTDQYSPSTLPDQPTSHTLPLPAPPRSALTRNIAVSSAVVLLLGVLINTVETRYAASRTERRLALQRSELQLLLFGPGTVGANERAAMQPNQHGALKLRQVTARGYGGNIVLVLALDRNDCIRAIAALRHHETADVGAPLLAAAGVAPARVPEQVPAHGHASAAASAESAAIANSGWLQQWRGACPIAGGSQAPDPVDNVTGATLTSRAVASALIHWRRTPR